MSEIPAVSASRGEYRRRQTYSAMKGGLQGESLDRCSRRRVLGEKHFCLDRKFRRTEIVEALQKVCNAY